MSCCPVEVKAKAIANLIEDRGVLLGTCSFSIGQSEAQQLHQIVDGHFFIVVPKLEPGHCAIRACHVFRVEVVVTANAGHGTRLPITIVEYAASCAPRG